MYFTRSCNLCFSDDHITPAIFTTYIHAVAYTIRAIQVSSRLCLGKISHFRGGGGGVATHIHAVASTISAIQISKGLSLGKISHFSSGERGGVATHIHAVAYSIRAIQISNLSSLSQIWRLKRDERRWGGGVVMIFERKFCRWLPTPPHPHQNQTNKKLQGDVLFRDKSTIMSLLSIEKL